MTGFLRFLGILNAAIWLGGSVYFTFVAGQLPFSTDVRALLGKLGPEPAAYMGGMIAQYGIGRFFTFQLVCGVMALLLLGVEWYFHGRRGRKFLLGLVAVILVLTSTGNFWLRPKMEQLFRVKYATNYPADQRAAAARSFGLWHGLSMTMNLVVLGGLGVYLWRLSRVPEPARFVWPGQIRG